MCIDGDLFFFILLFFKDTGGSGLTYGNTGGKVELKTHSKI